MQCDVGMVFLGRRERISMEEERQLELQEKGGRLAWNKWAMKKTP